MSDQKALDILKGAILLERRGKEFFEKTAQEVSNPILKQFFESMAKEEESHIKFLATHYTNLLKGGEFKPVSFTPMEDEIPQSVLTKEVREKITAAGFEASAIYAAMALEERAVQYYSARAQETNDPVEKEMYEWLANWEKTHLKILSDMDKELRERVWFDNQFWPVI